MKGYTNTTVKDILNNLIVSNNVNVDKHKNVELIFFDTETTGFSAVVNDIVQISFKKIYLDKQENYTNYVKPIFISDDYELSKPYRVHLISRKTLLNSPSFKNLYKKIKDFIGCNNENKIIIGHNVLFDVRFINEACIKCGENILINENFKILDTSQLYRLYSDLESKKNLKPNSEVKSKRITLDKLAEELKVDKKFTDKRATKHCASVDVELTYQCFIKMINKIKNMV